MKVNSHNSQLKGYHGDALCSSCLMVANKCHLKEIAAALPSCWKLHTGQEHDIGGNFSSTFLGTGPMLMLTELACASPAVNAGKQNKTCLTLEIWGHFSHLCSYLCPPKFNEYPPNTHTHTHSHIYSAKALRFITVSELLANLRA